MDQGRSNENFLYPDYTGLDQATLVGEPKSDKYHSHTAVAFGTEGYYGVRGHIADGVLVITEAMYQPVNNDSLFLGVTEFLKNYISSQEPMSIVGDCPCVTKAMIMDIKSQSIDDLVRWNGDTFINQSEGIYAYEFFTRTIPGLEQEGLLYVAGLKKDDLYQMDQALKLANSRVQIIDYWPAPLMYLYSYRNGMVLGEVKEDKIYLYAWWNGGFVSHKICNQDGQSVVATLKEIEEELYTYGIEEIEGLVIYNSHLIKKEEDQIDIEAIGREYGCIERLPVEFLPSTSLVYDSSNMYWEAALGLLMRGLHYTNINQ